MLSDRLIELRTKKGYTKKDIADYLKMSPEGYGYYESGKRRPSPDVLVQLSHFYNVSADYLLGLTDNPAFIDPKKASPTIEEATEVYINALIRHGYLGKGRMMTQEEMDRFLRVAKSLFDEE